METLEQKKQRLLELKRRKLELLQQASAPEGYPKFTPEPWTHNQDAGINPIKGNLEQLLSGGSLGLSDEIQAAIGAASTIGQTDMPYEERYKIIRDSMRGDRQEFIEQEGAIAHAPEVIGGGLTGLAGLAKSGGVRGAALMGAAEGGVAGAGYADAEKFASPETAVNAGVGAGIGAAAGPALVIGGNLVKKGAGSAWDAAKARFPNISGKAAQIAKDEAVAGSKPDEAARYILKKTGNPKKPYKATKDTLAIRAIEKQDIPEAMVNSIKELSPTDKQAAQKMLNIIKIGRTNTAFRDAHRPGDILGDTLKGKIDYISDVNTKARKQLNTYVNTALKGKPVNIDDALHGFATQLDDLGVTVTQTKNGKLVPDFDGALKLNTNDRKPIKEAIRKINSVLERGPMTADTAHDLKRALDNEIPWDATSKMTSEGEAVLKGLRHDINESLRQSFDKYAEINKVLEDTTGALKNIAKAAGRKYNPDSENAGAYLGQELRKLATNYNSRIPLTDSLNEVEAIARKYGMDSGADVARQASIVNDLEDLFGEAARRSLRGEQRKATRDALKETASGYHHGLVHRGIDKVHEVVSGVDPDSQIEIIEQLLKRQ